MQDDLFTPEKKALDWTSEADRQGFTSYWGRKYKSSRAEAEFNKVHVGTPEEHLGKLHDAGFNITDLDKYPLGYHHPSTLNSWTADPHPFVTSDERHAELSAAITHPAMRLEKKADTYTGLSWGHKRAVAVLGMRPGTVVHHDAFTASSTSKGMAASFTEHFDGHQHLAEWKLPAGYKRAAYIAPFSDHFEEHEVLIDKGTKFRYLGNRHDEHSNAIIHSFEALD